MTDDEPLVAGADMLDSSGLMSVFKGTSSGFEYNLMANSAGTVTVFVNLIKSTNLHLVAIGDKSKLASPIEKRIGRFIEPVELEGDFPDYFKMYCTPSRQIELRELFDPVEMQDFVSLCREYDFEIFYDAMYISQVEGSLDKDDQTTLIADVDSFIKKNSELIKKLQEGNT